MAKEEELQEEPVEKITMANTKREMLAAYNEMVKRLQQKRQAELKPAEQLEEKQTKEAQVVADSLSMDGIGNEIGNLKAEIGGMLAQISDRMEEEIGKYLKVKKAVAARESELKEIYEIERAASSLAALLEAQRQKREEFEAEMAEKKEELECEIEATREEWQEEKAAHEAEVKERDAAEKRQYERQAEELKYKFEREKQLAQEQFEYEKAKLERDMQLHRAEKEGDLAAREKALAEHEGELNQLRERAANFPKELEAAVAKAAKDTTDRLSREAQARQELMQKQFEGEQNVLNSRIESLQQTVNEQSQQIARLSEQLEKSYTQVQTIAEKAIEGPARGRPVPITPSERPQTAEPPGSADE